jgi:ribosome-associated translation inhibitor RaiA
VKIQVNTGRNVDGEEPWAQDVESTVAAALARFREQITRVEVHVSDLNSHKFGAADKRCVIEARLAGLQPIAASDEAATVEQAIQGAAGKLARRLDSTLGRRDRRRTPEARDSE